MRTVSRRYSLRSVSNARMDSTCCGPANVTNQKRTVGFALKSRLPSMYSEEKL